MAKVGARKPQAEMEVARPEVPRFERVTWYKEPHLRKLYAMSLVLMIASATTGYDGMLVNTSQQIRRWEEYFGLDIDDNNKLGVLINMFNIGSIVSFFITPYVADNYGRKNAIIAGCIFMIGGGCLTAFCDGYARKCGLASRHASGVETIERADIQCPQSTSQDASCWVSGTRWPKWPRPCC